MKAPSTARRLLGTAARATGLHPEQRGNQAHENDLPAGHAILFDEAWYAAAAGLDGLVGDQLIEHFRNYGAAKGLDPHPLFDVEHYRSQLGSDQSCPDPIHHYLEVGAGLGLDPHPLFATSWYLEHYPDVATAGVNPLAHYLQHGASEGRQPGPDFDGPWYLEQYRDVAAARMNPLAHYWLHGRNEGRFPSPEAKRSMLIAVNGGMVDVGAALPLDATDWRGPASLLAPPVSPRVRLDAASLVDHKVISFDVWDTLLMRRCHPEEVKLASARHLLLGFHRWIRPSIRSVDALYRLRLASEAKVSFGHDNEYRFGEAAVAWVEAALGATASAEVVARAVESLLANELATETRVTYRNPAMDRVLDELASRTLIFASDFYLPAKAIQRLLSANEVPANFARSWASCEQGEAKRSGRMFARILDELKVDGDDVVHIGDNYDADVVAASAAGLHTVHHEVDRLAELDDAVAGRIGGDHETYEPFIGACLAAVEDRLGADADRMTVLGVRFAPVAVGLALRIAEQALMTEADRISFFTREGVFLKRLVDLVIEGDPYGLDAPPTELIEISRRSTFAASLEAIDPAQLMRLWSMYSNQSPQGLVVSLGLDDEAARAVFADHDLEFDQPVRHPWENQRFLAALADPRFNGPAEERRQTQRELLGRYLERRDFLGQNPLVVDLGWRGTIQDNLSRAIGRPLAGVYLGLFEFLNDQPPNSEKIGWLFDHNDPDRDAWTVEEVAPLEMLFNGSGGSVTGYEAAGDSVIANRQVDPAEEAVITGPVAAFQSGVLAAAVPLIDLVSRHALTSDDLRPLARKLVQGLLRQPPVEIADAFFALSHNETFGTGSFQEMQAAPDLDSQVSSTRGNDLYSVVARAASESRWPEGMGARARSVIADQRGPRALHLPTRVFASASDIVTDGTVAIFAPAPILGSGGHRTIYNLAKGIAATGLDVRLFVDGAGTGLDDVVAQLRGSGVSIEIGWETATGFDYAIATIASSAGHVERVSAENRGYLIQDFEASFNPVSDGYIEAESSYRDGFDFLTVGSWLGHVLQTRYGTAAFSSGLGANHEIYRPPTIAADGHDATGDRPRAVCFLYQPEKPRRTPQLGIDALRIVKQACPDVEINVYGSEADIDLDFEVENHGLIRNLHELNELYNRCRIGLCLSMTNPSRIPFELMASGAVPVDVYRYNTLFDYDDGTAVLAYQSPASLAEAMIGLLTDDDRWRRHQDRCLDFIARRPLSWETDVMVNTILARISGLTVEPTMSHPTYGDDPIIAAIDAGRATQAFCDWQRRSANL